MIEYDLKQLDNPFKPSDIEWRVQQMGWNGEKPWAMVLAYVTNRAIMMRLDDVFGKMNWQNIYKEAPCGGVLCGISVKSNGEWVTKWDGAENTAVEATKGGLSGAMKRCAVQWGIGRYLYNLEVGFADCSATKVEGFTSAYDAKTKKKYFWNTPRLPKWALPSPTNEEWEQMISIANQSKERAMAVTKRTNEEWNLNQTQKQELETILGNS